MSNPSGISPRKVAFLRNDSILVKVPTPLFPSSLPFFHGHCATFTGTRPEEKNPRILSSVFKDSYNIRGSFMTRQNFFSDGIPQTGRWKTGRSLRWPPLGIPKSLPNLCSAVVACGLLRSSLDLGEEKHRPVDNASNLHPTDRYSALPGPPATVIQVSGSPSSRHRGEDDVSTREILLLRTPTLGSRRQVASSRGERGREKERSRRKVSSRIGKIQGTSDSVRGQNRLEMRAKASMPSRVTAGVPQVGHVQSRPPHERAREPISPFPSSVCLVSTIARVRWP